MTNEWRNMKVSDLPIVYELSCQIHPNYPERLDVFEERLRLYPLGCFIHVRDGRYSGYAISHPWKKGEVPKLDSFLKAIPARCDSYYLHDVALEPNARSNGAGTNIIQTIREHALSHSFRRLGLVAVNGSTAFWSKQGFSIRRASRQVLQSYDDSASYMECLI